ncbi:MAG: carbohydrate porin [Elainella sp.]
MGRSHSSSHQLRWGCLTLAFPDLGGRGNLGGVLVGMQPRLTGTTPGLGSALDLRRDPDVGLHVEAFYRLALNDNIDITPGVVWLTAPNHDADNADIILGVLRTTFRF